MDWDLVARITVAGLPFATAIAGGNRRSDPVRRQMAADAQVLQALPEGSEAHTAVLDVLAKAARTIQQRDSYSRDYASLIGAIIGSVVFGYLAIWLAQQGTWWAWALATISALIWPAFVYGIFDSMQLRDQVEHKAEGERRKAAQAAAKKVAK